SYYGPSPVVGTFGIALLSRTPLLSPRTFYMYSEGEQTATIDAEIETATGRCRVLATHLGNGGPLVQQEAILRALGSAENAILMGDFNFRPETEQYALTTQTLVDAWASAGGQPDADWLDPARRIDHIFVSPGVAVEEARYLDSAPSDHPPLLATVRCPGG
ncbi:MAG: endonuclease/exonuclease/phosphatase family protein, partial [Anaerolineae bacterium]|nr:endonuclease/exonuclease/phosphatase family protein [Anaerolineae bacterium]